MSLFCANFAVGNNENTEQGFSIKAHNVMTNDLTDSEIINLLPRELQDCLDDMNEKVFCLAFARGFIYLRDGMVKTRFQSTKLLSYFCGRCFAHDSSERVFKRYVWRKGNRPFPASELERFFNVTNLRETRKNDMDVKIPKGFEDVDNLFVTVRIME